MKFGNGSACGHKSRKIMSIFRIKRWNFHQLTLSRTKQQLGYGVVAGLSGERVLRLKRKTNGEKVALFAERERRWEIG
jgi:hypothetical protein